MSVDAFDYTDYRAFLRDAWEALRSRSRKYSYRYFASRAGIGSPSYLKLVMDGERSLSRETAVGFARALSLSPEQALYFCALVAWSQAKAAEERQFWEHQLMELRTAHQGAPAERGPLTVQLTAAQAQALGARLAALREEALRSQGGETGTTATYELVLAFRPVAPRR